MNDERMISQIPTVHKLDEFSSWCLADCSKYVRERVSEEESVKKSECGLSCWLVVPAARKRRERMCALSCWLACLAWKAYVEESKRMLPHLFIVSQGSDLGRVAWNILISQKYCCIVTRAYIFIFGDDTCMEQKAIAESPCTRRSCRETDEPVNNWL